MFKKGYKAGYVTVVLKARSWRRAPMRLLKWGRKMPSTKQYNLVTNDDYDTRIPLHPEEAFHYGIPFPAKYIGSMEVPRPTSRVEIVAAMRRVRYEFKTKGVKKRKVTVDVSIEGVRVTTRKKKTKSKKKKKNKLFSEESDSSSNGAEIMHHPIYRIFYVSHDSSDLKIFSYIARDGATNAFKCNVFKSTKKSQAMRIVRTVGQAFEVCHKMQNDQSPVPAAAPSTSSMIEEAAATSDHTSDAPPFKDGASECEVSVSGGGSSRAALEVATPAASEEQSRPQHLELPPPPRKDSRRSPQRNLPPPALDLPECITKVEVCSKEAEEASTPLSAQHQLQLLRERLEQQAQQTRAAVAQLLLLRDQLAAEQAARCEAQARTHQLLVHNKELLEHIAALVSHLQERERGSSRPINAQQLTLLPQAGMGQQQGFSTSISDGNFQYPNNNQPMPKHSDTLVNLLAKSNHITQNVQNNNVSFSPFNTSPTNPCTPDDRPISPNKFAQMSNEQIQNYLISKFKTMGEPEIKPETTERKPNTINYNQQFFQNSNAFPNIPPLTNHYSNTDIASLLNHNAFSSPQHALAQPAEQAGASASAMSLGQSQNSLCSSPPGTSNDTSPEGFSSDDGAFFIMPLSHNATLTSKSEDGRVKLIVPVSPSGSVSDVPDLRGEATSAPTPSGNTLRVPGAQDRLLLQPGPITRTTSEKVPNRSEMMAAMRSQWTRHTTK